MRDTPQDAPGSNRLPPLPGEPTQRGPCAAGAHAPRSGAGDPEAAGRSDGRLRLPDAPDHRSPRSKAGQRPVIVGEMYALAMLLGVGLQDLVTEPEQDELAQALADLARCQHQAAYRERAAGAGRRGRRGGSPPGQAGRLGRDQGRAQSQVSERRRRRMARRESPVLSGNGSTYKRCGCTDPDTGRQLGAACPDLRKRHHGTWCYEVRIDTTGGRRKLKRSGFGNESDARGRARPGRRPDQAGRR